MSILLINVIQSTNVLFLIKNELYIIVDQSLKLLIKIQIVGKELL